MNNEEKIQKAIDLIKEVEIKDKRMDPNEIYEAMREYSLFELAEGFSQIINLIADVLEVLEEDDSEDEKLDILEVTLLSTEEARNLPREMQKAAYSWWLRSPGYFSHEASYVSGESGVVHDYGFDVDSDFGVRPALKLNSKSSHLKSGDSFLYRGHEWDMIADDTALCRTIVGKCPFRKDLEADDGNSYESSDIKKWLAEWWKK